MGFIDRALRAAAPLKDQLDTLRDARAAARPTPAPAPPGGSDAGRQQLARALALGAIDPTALLTVEEATEIAGVPLGGPRLIWTDDSVGVSYRADGARQRHWAVEVSVFHAAEEEDVPFDARGHWYGYLAEAVRDEAVEVDGLGDAALVRTGEAFMLADPVVLWVTVRLPDGEDGTDHAIRTAEAAMRRLR